LDKSYAAAVTSEGYLLLVAISELPQLGKGKGNKIINIPAAKLKSGDEALVGVAVVHAGQQLVIHVGKKFKAMQGADLEEYIGERGRRGKLLPQGYRNVSFLEVR